MEIQNTNWKQSEIENPKFEIRLTDSRSVTGNHYHKTIK